MSTLYLAHHGIKGQKWGVRRFQNEDGTLTPAGRLRYGAEEAMIQVNRNTITKDKKGNRKYAGGQAQEAVNIAAKVTSAIKDKDTETKKEGYEKVIKALEITGGIVATAGTVIALATKGKDIYDKMKGPIGKVTGKVSESRAASARARRERTGAGIKMGPTSRSSYYNRPTGFTDYSTYRTTQKVWNNNRNLWNSRRW